MKCKNIYIISIIVVGIILGIYGSYCNNRHKTKAKDILQVISTESPSGFSGASMNKVELYSNGEAYLIKYNGDGYENENIISKTLIARKVENISVVDNEDSEYSGAVILKGKNIEIINSKYQWIIYSNE